MKKNLLVFFGGKSCEHDISIITAHQAIDYVDIERYNIIPIYVDINGIFLTGDDLFDFEFCKDIDYSKLHKVYFMPATNNVYYKKNKVLCKADAALLCMHGLNGEDGTLQGMLELSNIPYTSSGVLGSAVGMDKIAMKLFFKGLNLSVLPFIWFNKAEYYSIKGNEEFWEKFNSTLEYPVIVKPANLGSSIGITRCPNAESLKNAIEVAVKFDNRIIIEKALTDFKEVNCSVLGCSSIGAQASVCERPLNWQAFLSFEDKYINNGGKLGGMDSLKRRIPADITDEQSNIIKKQSVEIFKAMDCKGVVRIDYMIDNTDNSIYVNEINTIPGSLSYYLWDYEGVDFYDLMDRLIEYAIKEHRQKSYLKYAYQSNVLSGAGGGLKF